VTAGTIFDRTRTPLTVWFTVCWLFAGGRDGISALSLKRTLEIGSYQTAWAMLHRLRSVVEGGFTGSGVGTSPPCACETGHSATGVGVELNRVEVETTVLAGATKQWLPTGGAVFILRP
jgi:hypothetical protein